MCEGKVGSGRHGHVQREFIVEALQWREQFEQQESQNADGDHSVAAKGIQNA